MAVKKNSTKTRVTVFWKSSIVAIVIAGLQCLHIGTNLINIVKKIFVTENRTGGRFITVDAYNTQHVLDFYIRNDFDFFAESALPLSLCDGL